MMDGLMLVFLLVIIIVGGGILFLITHSKSRGSALDVERYRTAWLTIEQQLTKGQEASYHLAVLNADKLLDKALRQRRFKGETMGERMKSAASHWSDANAVWSAHKLRNRIAHESDVSVDYRATRRALASIKQGLKDLGAI